MSGPSGKGKGKGKVKGEEKHPPSITDDPKEVKWDDLQRMINGAPVVGNGRFGEVYEASFEGNPVAVKLADVSRRSDKLPQFDAEKKYLKMFKDEPRILQLIGYGEHSEEKKDRTRDKKVYLIYNWMETSVDKQIGDLDWERTKRILIQTAQGLAVLHQAGLVHSDIKPENLLIDKEDNVMLGDFGGIKEDGKDRLISTVSHMHPTDLNRGRAKLTDDIFSFGVTMLQLIMQEKNVGAFPDPDKTNKRKRTAKKTEEEDQHITLRVRMEDTAVTEPLLKMGCTKDKAKRIIALALECCNETASQRPEINKILQDLNKL